MHDVRKEIIQHGFKVFTIKYRPNTTMSIFFGVPYKLCYSLYRSADSLCTGCSVSNTTTC